VPVVNDAGTLVGILAVDDIIEVAAEQLSGVARLIGRERKREQQRRP
jgi:Mg/Co/Ni transporter MgtE